MKTTRSSLKRIFLILTVLTMAIALSSSAFAAQKRKRIKTMKEYESGKLTYSVSYSYDKYGNFTKAKWMNTYSGEKSTGTTKYKNTYWGGTRTLKKRVMSGSNGKSTTTYTRSGHLKKSVYQPKNGTKQITTYKYKGNRLVSEVAKDSKGKKLFSYTYDKHGYMKTYKSYSEGKLSYSCTYKNTYKSGILRKQVETNNKSVWINEYNKYGDRISYVYKYDGSVETKSTTKNTYSGGYLKKTVETYTYSDGNKHTVTTKYTYTSKVY